MPKLKYCCIFKKEFKYENYLYVFKYYSTRKVKSRLRLCSHNLEIELGRFHNIERDERKCRLCNINAVESQYHFYCVVQNLQT